MARAMMAWAEWNPKAIRTMSRILVFIDSTSALDRPCSIEATIASRLRTTRWASLTNWGRRQRRAQLIHRSSAFDGLGRAAPGDGEHDAQSLFQRPGPVQGGVGLGDPDQLLALPNGQVVGVLPQRPPGVLERLGLSAWAAVAAVAAGRAAGGVPGDAPLLIQGVGGPGDTWYGSAQRTACGQYAAMTSLIHRAESEEMWVICAQRAGPSRVKKSVRLAWSAPLPAQTRRPVSWSTTTSRYLCPLR